MLGFSFLLSLGVGVRVPFLVKENSVRYWAGKEFSVVFPHCTAVSFGDELQLLVCESVGCSFCGVHTQEEDVPVQPLCHSAEKIHHVASDDVLDRLSD